VSSDISGIKALGFTSVRIYSTECNNLEYVANAAASNGLKLILGVFIDSTEYQQSQSQIDDIVGWAKWELVEMIVVGNEAIYNNYLNASRLVNWVAGAKEAFKNAGYTGPVTTTDTLAVLQQFGSQFCGTVDVVAANLYAYYNPQTTAEQAGTFIQSELSILESICPGKPAYVLETGWPHAGSANGAAIPGVQEQITALTAIEATVGSKVVFFEYLDEAWKAVDEPNPLGVNAFWGVSTALS